MGGRGVAEGSAVPRRRQALGSVVAVPVEGTVSASLVWNPPCVHCQQCRARSVPAALGRAGRQWLPTRVAAAGPPPPPQQASPSPAGQPQPARPFPLFCLSPVFSASRHLCPAVQLAHATELPPQLGLLLHFLPTRRHLGLAFQLVDDILDFTATSAELGKPALNDLRSGLATAPVLFAAREQPELYTLIGRRFKEEGDVEAAQVGREPGASWLGAGCGWGLAMSSHGGRRRGKGGGAGGRVGGEVGGPGPKKEGPGMVQSHLCSSDSPGFSSPEKRPLTTHPITHPPTPVGHGSGQLWHPVS